MIDRRMHAYWNSVSKYKGCEGGWKFDTDTGILGKKHCSFGKFNMGYLSFAKNGKLQIVIF